jgi:integrase
MNNATHRATAARGKTNAAIAAHSATTHIYEREGVIYVYGRIKGKTHRYSTGRIATTENLEWAKVEWKNFLLKTAKRKEAKQAEKRRSARKAKREARQAVMFKQLKSAGVFANAVVENIYNGVMPTLAEYGVYALKLWAHSRKTSTNWRYDRIFRKRIVPIFGDLKLDEIRAFHVKRWQYNLIKEGLTANTIKQRRSVLSVILKEAISDEIIDRNPLSAVKPPKGQSKERKPFSKDEIDLILEDTPSQSKDDWFRDFLIVSFFTGLRTGEALALEWEHIDFDRKVISVTQTISNRVIGTPKTPSSKRRINMNYIVEKALRRQFLRTGRLNSFVFASR